MSHFQGRKEERPDVTAEDVYVTLAPAIEAQLSPGQHTFEEQPPSVGSTSPIFTEETQVPSGATPPAPRHSILPVGVSPCSAEALLPVFRRSFHLSAPSTRSIPVSNIVPVPPSVATLTAYDRLVALSLESPLLEPTSRDSVAYQALFNRFRALFLWPALLRDVDISFATDNGETDREC